MRTTVTREGGSEVAITVGLLDPAALGLPALPEPEDEHPIDWPECDAADVLIDLN